MSRLLATAFFIALLTSSCGMFNSFEGKRYALIYGAADYGGSISLEYTDDDAMDMNSMLSSKGYTTWLRLDNEVSKPNIENDFGTINNLITPGDTFIFFFSGHGGYSEPTNGEPEDSYDEYILMNDLDRLFDYEFAGLIQAVPTRNTIVIIDACNSGGFINDEGPVFEAIPDDFTGELYAGYNAEALKRFNHEYNSTDIVWDNAIVMSASGAGEFSLEPGQSSTSGIENGYFTYFLLESPAKADSNKDGYVTALEAYEHSLYGIVSLSFQDSVKYLPHISPAPIDLVLFEAD